MLDRLMITAAVALMVWFAGHYVIAAGGALTAVADRVAEVTE